MTYMRIGLKLGNVWGVYRPLSSKDVAEATQVPTEFRNAVGKNMSIHKLSHCPMAVTTTPKR